VIDERSRRIGVYGLCVQHGYVLLAQVAPEYSAVKPWTLPGGGMEWGESPRKTLLREFHEETGLDPDMGKPLFVRSRVVDNEVVGRPIHNLQIVFAVRAEGEPRPEVGGSTVDARWIPLAELDGMVVVPLVSESINRWRQGAER
jgi:8-oxo-dGTP diphosphatase